MSLRWLHGEKTGSQESDQERERGVGGDGGLNRGRGDGAAEKTDIIISMKGLNSWVSDWRPAADDGRSFPEDWEDHGAALRRRRHRLGREEDGLRPRL